VGDHTYTLPGNQLTGPNAFIQTTGSSAQLSPSGPQSFIALSIGPQIGGAPSAALAFDINGNGNFFSFISVGNGSQNQVSIRGSNTGQPVLLSALGGDPNIDMSFVPKGTGVVNLAYAVTALGGGAAPTLGTIGGSGPATAAQNSWLGVKINGTLSFLPVWR
jgi:hypothetical protein